MILSTSKKGEESGFSFIIVVILAILLGVIFITILISKFWGKP